MNWFVDTFNGNQLQNMLLWWIKPTTQIYTDAYQVYLSFRTIPSTNQTASVTAIENCVAKLGSWMIFNMLMVNDSKTDLLIVRSK